MTDITFFESPKAFRAWLVKHHKRASELWVGYHKKATGRATLTWPESVDEALCFGWIDGVRKRLDGERYVIRFSPRKPGSVWSALNLKKMAELKKDGRMTGTGLAVFEARDRKKSGYAVRNFSATLDAASMKAFKANRKAWRFFETQPPGYKRILIYWMMNAKRPATRGRRLSLVIEASTREERLGMLGPPREKKT